MHSSPCFGSVEKRAEYRTRNESENHFPKKKIGSKNDMNLHYALQNQQNKVLNLCWNKTNKEQKLGCGNWYELGTRTDRDIWKEKKGGNLEMGQWAERTT